MTVNFYGIKVGDVNQSLIEPRSAQTLDLAIDAANYNQEILKFLYMLIILVQQKDSSSQLYLMLTK
ncbi:MAG: hypothetical protein R2771_06665 [Saprospiraceae bacterium]